MPPMPRAQQFDLFMPPNDTTMDGAHWQALPVETRQIVTKLMVRLILDHVGGRDRAGQQEGAGHDA